MRRIAGLIDYNAAVLVAYDTSGAFAPQGGLDGYWMQFANPANMATAALFDSARVVPTAPVNRPRAWGALACCYLGAPR